MSKRLFIWLNPGSNDGAQWPLSSTKQNLQILIYQALDSLNQESEVPLSIQKIKQFDYHKRHQFIPAIGYRRIIKK